MIYDVASTLCNTEYMKSWPCKIYVLSFLILNTKTYVEFFKSSTWGLTSRFLILNTRTSIEFLNPQHEDLCWVFFKIVANDSMIPTTLNTSHGDLFTWKCLYRCCLNRVMMTSILLLISFFLKHIINSFCPKHSRRHICRCTGIC